MATVSKWWGYIKISLAFIGTLIGAVIFWGSKRAARKLGEEVGHLEEDRTRLREAAAKGDDDAVLDEWRRSRQ